jgi:drug/metabolite transporter (DMT)-like permease
MAMLTGGGLLLALSATTGEWGRVSMAAFTPTALGALSYLVFAGSLLGFSTYMWLLRVASPTRVATYAYVNPVIALFLGWAFGGETLAASTLVAVAISLFGVFLVVTARS